MNDATAAVTLKPTFIKARERGKFLTTITVYMGYDKSKRISRKLLIVSSRAFQLSLSWKKQDSFSNKIES